MILPEDFVKRTRGLLGEEGYEHFVNALNAKPVVSIRVNDKMNLVPSDSVVPWCENAYYLEERPLFTADPFFHCGAYYVQEASSMFLQQAVKQHFPDAKRVLDLCAAPGGKSTLLRQSLAEDALLVCNEVIPSRAHILAENIIKWGNNNVLVTNNQPRDFAVFRGYFDAVVVDAPCSGEGMFRKDEGAITEWSEKNVALCAARQKEILVDVWDALKQDGILVYSTCTYNREENEENVRWISDTLNAEVLQLDLAGNENITPTDCGYRFYPHRTKGEGFFLAVLRKKEATAEYKMSKKQTKKAGKKDPAIPEMFFRLKQGKAWEYEWEMNLLYACIAGWKDDFDVLKKHLRCIYSSLLLGEMKGKDFIPAASLAFSKELDLDSVNKVNVDKETAIRYLKREAVTIPESARGYVLLCYENQPLGWLKNLGNRCNNLYPQEWRIRMNI